MALSAQTLRASNNSYTPQTPANSYIIPPAGRSRPVTYSSQTFSSHLHHQYSIGAPPSNHSFSIQNSMVLCPQPPQLPPLAQTGLLPPLPSSTNMSLPDSPVQSVSSHSSPIPPNSPSLEEQEAGEQYKICNYRPAVSNPFGMSSPFSSYPSSHQPSTLPMPCGMGMGYATPPSTMCPPSMYPQDMCPNGTSSLGLPVWNYPNMVPSMGIPGNSMGKLSLDSPRYKLTPERAVPLVKWFEDHKEHPYPTRHEKVLLCQSTQLTYTQVSTWFANARRRMKKANSEDDENRSNHSCSDDCASLNSLDSPDPPDQTTPVLKMNPTRALTTVCH